MDKKLVHKNTTKLYMIVAIIAIILGIISGMLIKSLINKYAKKPSDNHHYSCPKKEYIDCTTGIDKKNTSCQKDYLVWAKINCTNFKGVTY